MKMLSWYKSWFCTSGSLCFVDYAKHLLAAGAFSFGFYLLGLCIFALGVGLMIALHAPDWVAWAPILIYMPLGLLAVGSWFGIVTASTIRFVRHLMAG